VPVPAFRRVPAGYEERHQSRYGFLRSIVALIDDRAVIEPILRRLGLWDQGVRVTPATGPPHSAVVEPCLDDLFSDYDTEPVTMYATN